MAMTITVGIGMVVFQLFRQNEQVFRDQNLIVEMQQNARAVAAQIADEIRLAGQGVPVYAATFDDAPSDAVVPIMASSTSTRIDFRSGLSNVDTFVASPLPIEFTVGTPTTFLTGSSSGFSPGDFVYVWGAGDSGTWGWTRAEVIGTVSGSMTVVPRQTGSDAARFSSPPTVSLEEAISFQQAGTSIRRATMSGSSWSAANEIGRNFSSVTFTYYDTGGKVVTPGSLTERASIVRVDVKLVAQTTDVMSNGTRPTYTVSLTAIPRNLRIR
jgi:hypothetical protein